MNFLTADVPDPTDFPPQVQAPGLRTLDGSFRCDICGELYDAPVTIVCGHCFCSACIRTSLSNKQECPSCRRRTDETHIRPNPALESVISAWKDARPFVLQLLKEREDEITCAPLQSWHQKHDRNKEVPKKRRRLDMSCISSPEPSHSRQNVADSSRDISPPRQRKQKSEDIVDVTSDRDEDEIEVISSNGTLQDNSLVTCPVCSKKMKYKLLNTHMDNQCKDPNRSADNAAKSWSKIMGGNKNGHQKGKNKKKGTDSDDEYPLPLCSYATLKDKQIKDILIEQDLPVTGDRSNWEQRHQRWVTLYNANLDRSIRYRKTKTELRKELRKWEEEMSKKKKPPMEDLKEYQKKHKAEFAKLVEAARLMKTGKSLSTQQIQSEQISPSAPPQLSPQPDSNLSDTIVVDSEEEQ